MLALVVLGVSMSGQQPDQQANADVVKAEPVHIAAPPVPHTPSPPLTPPPERELIVAEVKPGDSLAKIFKRHGLGARDLYRVVNSGSLGSRLTNIYPGHELAFERDDNGNLVYLRYSPGRLETVEFKRVGEQFKGTKVVIEPDKVLTYKHAVIETSLYAACQRANLTDQFAEQLADIFQWDIDFILDIRTGDEFHLLYHERHIDGRYHDLGDILAAEVVSQGKSHYAVRYEDETGNVSYYTPDGQNMRKAFLRTPLDFSRISSNFNLKRVHPLWKKAMPHLGIDYAAPTGTRVKAAGDGIVVTASRTKANGKYIVLQHGRRYRTKYLHLSRFAPNIRKGRKVTQSETIGFVGQTGWATGPHLHYEFLVDGVHQNPRTVQLPSGTPISSVERETFDIASKSLLAQLEDYKTRPQLAYTESTAVQ